MNIVCLDLEGVLVPEIWIAFAKASGIPELKRTTRDEPDYDKLMNWRLGILKEHGLGLKEIQETIATIDPIPGAKRHRLLSSVIHLLSLRLRLWKNWDGLPFSAILWKWQKTVRLPDLRCELKIPNIQQ